MKRCRLFALLLALALVLTGCGAAQSETEETIQAQTSEGSAGCLFENDACSYTLIKANENALGDYTWDVELVNKTAQALVFSMDSVYLNDCKLDPYWAVEVAAGQTLRSDGLPARAVWGKPRCGADYGLSGGRGCIF